MLVGMGGNNGSTFLAGLLAHSKKLTWDNKSGNHSVKFAVQYPNLDQFILVMMTKIMPILNCLKILVGGGCNMCSPEDLSNWRVGYLR